MAPCDSGVGSGELIEWRDLLLSLDVACKGSAMKMNDHCSDDRLRTVPDGTEMVHCCDSCGVGHSHGVAKVCADGYGSDGGDQ